jgi:hypothetical protein
MLRLSLFLRLKPVGSFPMIVLDYEHIMQYCRASGKVEQPTSDRAAKVTSDASLHVHACSSSAGDRI